ncbi:Universal stress protein [Mycobacteroides abscessus subsp. abscessus]|nr:Universal stress protein [Mycobacteroides abscessus subsp. abscessus]
MNEIRTPGPAVLVGIDGSRSAVRAALWAVDEALHRELPLRLVHVTPQTEFPEFSDERSPAGTAVRHAFRQIGATHKPVKVEAEIRHGRVADVLLDASRSAVMLCVGAIGISGADTRKVGSTAAEVLRSVRCPVAVIRDDPLSLGGTSAVVVEIDESHESVTPLELAAHEARLRAAPLRVLLRHRPISLSGQRVATLTRVDRRAADSDRVDIGRTFPVVAERASRPGLQEDQAKVLALSTARDTPKNLLRCGELLSEVLLEATLAGMATCTITHMLELTASREVVGAAIGRSHPQALIRVGLAPTFGRIPPPTPRRSLADVLEIRS